MSPEVGARVIAEARSNIGAHYIHGAYGATPGNNDGHPRRAGMVELIRSHDRLDPKYNGDNKKKNIAVYAAQVTIIHPDKSEHFSVCAGNNESFPGGRPAYATDHDIVKYIDSLKKIRDPKQWPYFVNIYSPRRVYGPGPDPATGDIGGILVWGQVCEGVRHFDCVGFVNYCLWKGTGIEYQLSIAAWHATPQSQAATVYDLSKSKPDEILDGDILCKGDHHIALLAADGSIIEAQDTDVGVRSTGTFSLTGTGGWTHLVRLPNK
jgi:hypothetical protein